jgi:proline iminopeptidase
MDGDGEVVEVVAGAGGPLWTVSSGSGNAGVLLCHGGPGMSDNLGPVAAMIDDQVRVQRFDQRACGRSGGASADQDLDSAIADIEALRVHWGYDSWVVGGHSWGAALALFYTLAHPGVVDGLIYISGVGVGAGSKMEIAALQRQARAARLARLSRPANKLPLRPGLPVSCQHKRQVDQRGEPAPA